MICKCLCTSFYIDPTKSIYRDYFVRLVSFSANNWPSNHTLHPYVLAKCGFFVSSNQNDELITATGRKCIADTCLSSVNCKLQSMLSQVFKRRGGNNEKVKNRATKQQSKIRIQCFNCQYGRYTPIDNPSSSSSSSSSSKRNTPSVHFLQQHRYVSPECVYAKVNA